jgi:hypothetical protein
MEKEWIVLISSLSGIIVGSASTYFLKKVEYNYQELRDDKKLKLEKLELIHELVFSISNKINSHFVNSRILRMKLKSIQDPQALVETAQMRLTIDLDLFAHIFKMGALVDVYADEFSKENADLLMLTQEFIGLIPDWHDEALDIKKLELIKKDVARTALDLQYKIANKIKLQSASLKNLPNK